MQRGPPAILRKGEKMNKEELEEAERKRKFLEDWEKEKEERRLKRWQESQKGKVRLLLWDKEKQEHVIADWGAGRTTFVNVKQIKQNFIFIKLKDQTINGGRYDYSKLKLQKITKFDEVGHPVYTEIEEKEKEEFIKWCKGYTLTPCGQK